MPNLDGRSLAGLGLDLEVVHQPAGTENAEPHAALGTILAVQNGLDVGNAGALVGYPDMEDLRRGRRIENELGAAASGIAEGISRQLRDHGCNPGLVLAFKS